MFSVNDFLSFALHFNTRALKSKGKNLSILPIGNWADLGNYHKKQRKQAPCRGVCFLFFRFLTVIWRG